jgi:hypothetical protein
MKAERILRTIQIVIGFIILTVMLWSFIGEG